MVLDSSMGLKAKYFVSFYNTVENTSRNKRRAWNIGFSSPLPYLQEAEHLGIVNMYIVHNDTVFVIVFPSKSISYSCDLWSCRSLLFKSNVLMCPSSNSIVIFNPLMNCSFSVNLLRIPRTRLQIFHCGPVGTFQYTLYLYLKRK